MRSRSVKARRGSRPLWTRLLALIVAALAGTGVVAAPSVRDRLVVVAQARHTEAQVVALEEVLALRAALMGEMVPSEAAARSSAFGLSKQQASNLLGFDLEARLITSRTAVDAALAELETRELPELDGVRATLRTFRAKVDLGAADADELHQAYTESFERVTALGNQQLDVVLSTAAGGGAAAGGVGDAVHRLVDCFDLVRAGQAEVTAMFHVVMATTPDERDDAIDQLVSARAVYAHDFANLARAQSPELRSSLASLASSPDALRFAEEVDEQVAARDGLQLGVARLAATFRSSFGRTDQLQLVLEAAAAEATGAAHELRGDATRRLLEQSLLMGGLALATTAAALAIAWSLTRRLRRLADAAARVSEGQLDGAPADEQGPREVVVVAQALNDAVANLRHIEAQAAALANGDLDNPTLATPAAGPLGESIHATVQRLSQAWLEGEQLQQRLAHQANHDLLTTLPNRKAALEALDFALGRSQRHGAAVTVLFVDLDGFKRANDAHGHLVGDAILRTCASRLRRAVRSGDVVARLGGDEFAVISDGLATAREAVELGEQLIRSLAEPIEARGVTARVGASIGVGRSLDGRTSSTDLLRDADIAVYRAKQLGKGRVEIFDEHARAELAAQTDLEDALRRALEDGELALHYQPVTDTATGRLRGFEALARWERAGVPISPAEFIPVAEQSDLVNHLGRWALAQAASQLAEWSERGLYRDAYVAVNVSGRHILHPSLVGDVRAALAGSGLDPGRLVVEITESVVVNDVTTAVAQLDKLRALGVRVALDDFGTGYTSIGQLWRLPVDIIKIDRSFVTPLEEPGDHVIVRLMIEVAHTLGLDLVAEGVETAAQRDALRILSCDAIQGYLVARPQPPEQLDAPEAWLAAAALR
ncbi:MAG: putative bifunctional diguanylate cyclase/phosphodiesterase [Acidimicrobiales bacterium]